MAIGSTEERSTLAVCPGCGERNPSVARFCIHCGARMTAEEGERRTVTVLFADLSGFTSYSERVDIEAVRALADAAAGGFGGIVRRHGGRVDKIIGDCVMAVYGAPDRNDDDPARAVRSALEMQAYVAAHPEQFAGLALSIGVHTGEAMYAPVGPQGEYTVLGDTVNTAARLQSAANAGEVLIGDPTGRSVAGIIELEPAPPLPLSSSDEPLGAWRAVRPAGDEEGHATRSRFVGRDMPMRRLAELWERARTENAAYLACITGAPGIGKSRLIEQFRSTTRDDLHVYGGRCLPYGEGFTYWALSEIIKAAAGILHDDAEDVISKKLGVLLEGLAIDDNDQLRTIAVAVANVVASPTTPRGTYMAERISRSELHWGIRRLFELHARRRPVMLVIEGLHWAEPALLELLMSIATGRAEAPVFVVGSAGEAFADDHPDLVDPRKNRRLIELDPLDESEARALLDSIDANLNEKTASRLVAAARGDPLFLEEAWRLHTSGGDVSALSGDLTELTGARLDHVDPDAVGVAGAAAIVGHIFWSGAVERLVGPCDERFALLERHDLIRTRPTTSMAGEREYEFRHIVVLREALRRIPAPDRARMHADLAEWVTGLPGAEREFVEFIAYHSERACLLDPSLVRSRGTRLQSSAIAALERAGRKAEEREGMLEAARWYERALTLAGDDLPDRAAELTLLRAQRLSHLYQREEALDALDRVVALSHEVARPDLRSRALLTRAMLIVEEDPSGARAACEEVGTLLATSVDDASQRIERALVSGRLRANAGDRVGAIAELEEALAEAEALGDPELLIRTHQHLAWGLLREGRLVAARDHLVTSAELARVDGSLTGEIASTWVLAELAYYVGPQEESERYALRTIAWLERSPDPLIAVRMHLRLAAIALNHGVVASAERHTRDAYEVARGVGGTLLVDAARHLGQVLLRQGRVTDAERMARVAGQNVTEGDPRAEGAVRLLDAYLSAARRESEAARAGFEAGIASLADDPLEQAETRILYARALDRLGDTHGALDQLRRARVAFENFGAEGMVVEVRALIDAVETGGTFPRV